jgi:hypothetical protein
MEERGLADDSKFVPSVSTLVDVRDSYRMRNRKRRDVPETSKSGAWFD